MKLHAVSIVIGLALGAALTIGIQKALHKSPAPIVLRSAVSTTPVLPKLYGSAYDAPISEEKPVYFEPGYAIYKVGQKGHMLTFNIMRGDKSFAVSFDLTLQNGFGNPADYKSMIASLKQLKTQ